MTKKQTSKANDEEVETQHTQDKQDDLEIDRAEPEDSQQVEAAEEERSEGDILRTQVAELEDKLLRMAAEFDNYRKRISRQYEDMVRSANDSLIMELLEVVDNFERALNHTKGDTDFDSFYKGTELILNQMTDLLHKHEITPIEAVGKPFDPNLHEAMMQIESDEYGEGVVAMEMARGYRQGQRVIRHSKVGVSAGKKQSDEK